MKKKNLMHKILQPLKNVDSIDFDDFVLMSLRFLIGT